MSLLLPDAEALRVFVARKKLEAARDLAAEALGVLSVRGLQDRDVEMLRQFFAGYGLTIARTP